MAETVLAAPRERRLGLPTKLAYGFGSIAYGIKDNGFSTLLLLFYNQGVGLPADQVGLAIMAALVFDAFVDPVIGHLSDHLQTRWGRRHPFMYASAIPIGVLYLLLWNPPRGSTIETLGWLFAIAVLVRTAISCYEVPSSALAPELTSDYHERTSVLGYRYLFGWLGGMGMLLLTFAVFLANTPDYPQGQLNPHGYVRYSYVAAALMTAAILMSALGTHRQIKYLPRAAPVRPPIGRTFHAILGTLSNKAFLVLFLTGICTYTNQGLTFALATYFNTYLWEFGSQVLVIYTIAVLLGVVLAFGFVRRLSRRVGKKRAGMWCVAIYPVIAAAPMLGRVTDVMPANGTLILLPLLMGLTALAQVFGVGVAIMLASMMADVVEDAQARSGERREGIFFAGSFFMQKCVSGFGLFLTGAILTAVAFPIHAVPGKVGKDVLDNLVLVYCGLMAVFSLIALFVLSKFPLGGEAEHRQRLERLAETASHGVPLPGSEPEIPVIE